jgi:hypothetical protein
MGAWEAFDTALGELLQDQAKQSIALKWLEECVAHANQEPGKFTYSDTQSRDALRRACEQQRQLSSDKPQWEHRFDVIVPVLWFVNPLLRIAPKRTLAKLAELPHPAFVCSALTESLGDWATTDLATLITAAPLAFDGADRYLHSGAVVVELLNRAGAAVRRKAMDAEGRLLDQHPIPCPSRPGQAALGPASARSAAFEPVPVFGDRIGDIQLRLQATDAGQGIDDD